MKYFLVLFSSLFILGCVASQNQETKTRTKANTKNASSKTEKQVVYDEEFNFLLAPDFDYENDDSYENQIKIKNVKIEASERASKNAAAK